MDLTFEFAKLKFSTTCRACLNQDGPFLATEDSNIFKVYSKITGIKVFPLEELPQVICVSCGETLKHIKKFIELCESSDESLRVELRNYHQIKTERLEEEIKSEPTESLQDFKDSDEGVENIWFELQEDTEGVMEQTEQVEVEQVEQNLVEKKTLTYMCGSCGENFPNNKLRTVHQQESTTCKKNEFKCRKCEKIFKSYHNLKEHMHCHIKEKQFQCNICLTRFRFQGNLSRHTKIHLDIKRLQCPVCFKEFSETSTKEEHMRTIHPLTCKCCNVEYKNYATLRQHLTDRLQENGENSLDDDMRAFVRVKCPECGLLLSRNAALRQHLLIHKGEKNFKCSVCDKRFYTKFALQGHFKVHSGEKPFQCPRCDRRFSSKSNLTNHFRLHEGIRPYSCKLCYMAFTQSTQLKTHMKTHTGEKPHVCRICDRRFAHSGNLKVHMKIHTD